MYIPACQWNLLPSFQSTDVGHNSFSRKFCYLSAQITQSHFLGDPLSFCYCGSLRTAKCLLDCVWNVMAHAQKPDFVFRRKGRIHLNRPGRQFSRLLAAEVCALAVVMLDATCSEVVWRVLATHSIHQFPPSLPLPASPCAITFKLDSSTITPAYYFAASMARTLRAVSPSARVGMGLHRCHCLLVCNSGVP